MSKMDSKTLESSFVNRDGDAPAGRTRVVSWPSGADGAASIPAGTSSQVEVPTWDGRSVVRSRRPRSAKAL
jgi:hypothetical protein